MKLRHLAAWFSGVVLLGTGAMFLSAQAPQPPRAGPVRTDRDKLRAEVIRLRTEVEMARFDYEFARDDLLENLKIVKGLKMGFEMLGSFRITTHEAGTDSPDKVPPPQSEEDRKKEAEAAQEAERKEQEDAAETAAFIAKYKPELIRLFTLLSEKRLDLEDAEWQYRETSR